MQTAEQLLFLIRAKLPLNLHSSEYFRDSAVGLLTTSLTAQIHESMAVLLLKEHLAVLMTADMFSRSVEVLTPPRFIDPMYKS